MTMKPRKIFTLLLVAALAVSLFPTAALAAGPIELYGGGGGGGGGGGAASTINTSDLLVSRGSLGFGGASVGGGAGGNGGFGGPVMDHIIAFGGGGGGGAGGDAGAGGANGADGGETLQSSKGTPDAGGNATDGNAPNGGRGGDGAPGADQIIIDSSADPSDIKVFGGNGGNAGGGAHANGTAAQGGDGGDGGRGGDAKLTLTALAVACTGPIDVIGGSWGANGATGLGYNSGTGGERGSGGAGGDATLQCPGTLSTPSITVTRPSGGGTASATIGTLLVAAGGTTVTNNSGTVTIGTIKFDSSSTRLNFSPGTVGVTNVSFTPPATANGGSTAFYATRFTSGRLSVDTSNLNLNPGETITLLVTFGGVPAAWNNQTFGDYKTEISGESLLLHRVANTPVNTPKPPSTLPKTGDGFPLSALLALLCVGFIAMAFVGMRLRKQRKGE